MDKKRVLWIEDGATWDIPYLTAPLYIDGGFDLVLAENPSDGIKQIYKYEYDVIIVDIRLLPGEDIEWIRLYHKLGGTKQAARLGLHFLFTILNFNDAIIKRTNLPEWISITRIGILTIERFIDIEDDIIKLQIPSEKYMHKDVNIPETALLDLIKKIV